MKIVKCCWNCSHLNDELVCCCPDAPQFEAEIDDPSGDGCDAGFELSCTLSDEDILRESQERGIR